MTLGSSTFFASASSLRTSSRSTARASHSSLLKGSAILPLQFHVSGVFADMHPFERPGVLQEHLGSPSVQPLPCCVDHLPDLLTGQCAWFLGHHVPPSSSVRAPAL